MSTKVQPVPVGYHALTPYLCVKDTIRAIEFYQRAFGATELMRIADPGGKVGHAEMLIGDSRVMLADEFPEMNFLSPRTLGGSPVTMHLYVEDADAVAQRAVAAGARLVKEVKDQFYGDRGGTVEDPDGHVWFISTHQEDVTLEEIKRRAAGLSGPQTA